MPTWSLVDFNPSFKENLYFVYLGTKKDSGQAVKDYRERGSASKDTINIINALTKAMAVADDLCEFEKLLIEHEDVVSRYMGLKPIKKTTFFRTFGEQ